MSLQNNNAIPRNEDEAMLKSAYLGNWLNKKHVIVFIEVLNVLAVHNNNLKIINKLMA